MSEARVYSMLVLLMFVLAGATVLGLLRLNAPYGRYVRSGWGPLIPSRVGWIVMESPAIVAVAAIFALGRHRAESVPLVLLGMWLVHYVNRTLIFPFQLRVTGKKMPSSVVLMAIAFNSLNAYDNARWISHFGTYSPAWLSDPRFVLGAVIMFAGFTTNVWADAVLRNLRKPGEVGYKIPRGGLYELVSCPNYLAEITEWLGWAVATWSLAGLAFAVYTAANIGPRAIAHHAWYRSEFADYPVRRKALIPFVL